MSDKLEKEYKRIIRRIAVVKSMIEKETKKYGEPRDRTVLRGDNLLDQKNEVLASMAEAEAEKEKAAKKKKVERTPEKQKKLRSLSSRGGGGGGKFITPDGVARRGRPSLLKKD